MKVFLREYIISILLTILLIFILSIIISTTDISENIIKPTIITISSISTMIGGFRVSKTRKQKGIINGSILGIIYIITLYILSSLINLEFTITISTMIMMLLGILGGAVGGIIGVNF